MEYNDKKYILKKLMQDALTEEERIALLSSRQVTQRMKHQWGNALDAVSKDHPDELAMWKNIRKEAWQDESTKRVVFYKLYSLAASILLLLGVAGAAYFALTERQSEPMYVVSSGIQNMESVSLPDGTKVQMGPGSRLTYPARFSVKTREVTLTGQAFFDVAKDRTKPFIVHTANMKVQALGTAFELFSYEMENTVEAILLNGKIKVGVRDGKSGKEKEYLVSPNEMLVFNRLTNSLSTQKVDADKYSAWRKQRILSFENEKLAMVTPRLEQWYGRKIMCQKDLAEKYRFTFKVRDESLDRILYMMGESSPLKYTKTNNGDYIVTLK